MTDEEKKAIEEAEKVAAQQKLDDDEEDLADVVVKSFEDLQKMQVERDNYRDGMLKAKGKKADDETDEERIERIVAEKIASSQFGTLVQNFQKQVKDLAHQNKELKVANRSKKSMESKGGGGDQGGDNVSTDPLVQIPVQLRERLANVSETSRNKLIEKWRAAGIIK